MGYQRKFDDGKSIQGQPPCLNLRSKAIYVTGDPDPQTPEEEGSSRFNCWCNKTQHTIGPDHELVDRSVCIEGRACFQPRA